MSVAAGLPGWMTLLSILVTDVENEDPSEATGAELRNLLDAGKLLEVADHCRQRLGERRYQELLGQQLRGGSGEIPEAHGIITQLPFSAIVTTNYDKLLERAYTRVRGDLPKVVTARDRDSLGSLLFSGGFFILKAHGDIDDAASLVLTARDYREIIHANPAFDALFSALLMTRSILFVGYSLADPDFRLLLDRQLSAFGENIPERYAVMSGMGPVERDVLKRAANIKVLSYPDGRHEEVTVFLRTLRERTGPDAGAAVVEPGAAGPAVERPAGAPRPAPRTGAVPRAAMRTAGPPLSAVTSHGEREATLVIQTLEGRIEATLRTETGHAWHPSEPMSWSSFHGELAALLEPGPASSERAMNYRRAGSRLADLLPKEAIAALPSDRILTIDAVRELANVPWELALCDGNEPLAVARPVIRTMTAHTAAARGLPGMRHPLRLLVVGDPGTEPVLRLPGAYDEAVEIAHLYRRAFGDASCTLLCREEASLTAFVDAVTASAYDVIHFAGHAWFDAQESYLSFDRGDQITASELRSLLGRKPPALLFLNSHYTAFLPRGMRPVELSDTADVEMPPTSHIGFTPTAVAAGVGAFVGCFSSPMDNAARDVGIAIHREFIGGAALAAAVRSARREALALYADDVSPLQYVLAGHPHYRMAGGG